MQGRGQLNQMDGGHRLPNQIDRKLAHRPQSARLDFQNFSS